MTPTTKPPTRTLDADAHRIHEALSSLIRVYQFRDRDRICRHDLSVSQCWALDAVVRAGGATLNEVAGELFLEKSTASRVVAQLVEKGYVGRRPHPDDGRAILLEATGEGEELHRRIRDELVEEEKRLLSDFKPEVRKALGELLERLADAAARCVDTSGGCCTWIER